jgi:sugar/nucleoside kinase (ribokinase family)
LRTYLAIGSVCWDEIPGVEGGQRRLGGSVLFAAHNARAAGWRTVVVTAGTEALADAARAALVGIELVVQPSATDTVMVFDERTELGPLLVPTVSDPIDLGRVGAAGIDADVVHVAPIMGEIGPNLFAQLGRRAVLGITPQGLLRERDRHGRLALASSIDPWWVEAVDVAVVSEAEHRHLAEALDPSDGAVAITRGERGCWGWLGDERVDLVGVPIRPSPAGTIGAGDVFASSLLMALAEGESFAGAMDRANHRAAAHVAGEALG